MIGIGILMAIIIKPGSNNKKDTEPHKDETTLSDTNLAIIILSIIAVFLIIAVYFGILSWLVIELLTAVYCTYSTLTTLPNALTSVYVNVLDPALVGAVSGLAIGWIRRVLALQNHKGDSLVSATVSSVLHINRFSLSQFLVHAIGGFAVGVCFSSGGVFLSAEMVRNGEPANLFPMGTQIYFLSGPGAGGGGEDLWLWLDPFPALLIVAIIIAIIVMFLVDRAVVWIIFKWSVRGGISGSAEQVVSAFVDEWNTCDSSMRMWGKIKRNGAVNGAVTGGIVGIILLVLRPHLM